MRTPPILALLASSRSDVATVRLSIAAAAAARLALAPAAAIAPLPPPPPLAAAALSAAAMLAWYAAWVRMPIAAAAAVARPAAIAAAAALVALPSSLLAAAAAAVLVCGYAWIIGQGTERYARAGPAPIGDVVRLEIAWGARWRWSLRSAAAAAAAAVVVCVCVAGDVCVSAMVCVVAAIEGATAWRHHGWDAAVRWEALDAHACALLTVRALIGENEVSHGAVAVAAADVVEDGAAVADDVAAAFVARHDLGPWLRKRAGATGVWEWRACARARLPCPFLYTVNVLGLNTPPCCARTMVSMVHAVSAVLTAMGIGDHWLDGGTLLGAVRDHGLIPWEDDVDLGFYLPPTHRHAPPLLTPASPFIVELQARLAASASLALTVTSAHNIHIFAALPPAPLSLHGDAALLVDRAERAPRVDLVPYSMAADGSPFMTRKGHKGVVGDLSAGPGFPAALILPVATRTVRGMGATPVRVPAHPEQLLAFLYGDFMTPVYSYLITDTAELLRVHVDKYFVPYAAESESSSDE